MKRFLLFLFVLAGLSVLRCGGGGGGSSGSPKLPELPPATERTWVAVFSDIQDEMPVDALVLGDLDGDGFDDLVLTTGWVYYHEDVYWYSGYSYYGIYDAPMSSTRVLKGDGRGVFARKADAIPDPSTAKGMDVWQGDMLALGDLDGDADLDLVVGYSSPAVSNYYVYSYKCKSYSCWYQYWYLEYGNLPSTRGLENDGSGKFRPMGKVGCGAEMFPSDPLVSLGDVDGDGDLEKLTYTLDGGFVLWELTEK